MGNLNIDFSSVGSREPLPEGTYIFAIRKATQKTAKTSGATMIEIQFQEPDTKTVVYENFVIEPKSLWKLKELLACLGFDVSGALDFEPSEIEGQMIKAKVIQEVYNDEVKNRIKKFMAC